MRRIVFLVKNYIGFGHIRRCLLIADELHALDPGIDIVFVSQAKSLLLFENTPYRVVNFPFLHRLPTNALAATYEVLLHQIVANLDPMLIIEDTYPDEWYLSIPSLQNVPKILVLRRVDPLSFDDFRRQGYFAIYDRILVVQGEEEFFSEAQVPESELLVRLGGMFRFIGPVFSRPTQDEIDLIGAKYAREGQPLVVVSAGAGGDQSNDAYCTRLFTVAGQVAKQFAEHDIPAHFVIVTGPYYRGSFLASSPNLTVVGFEPHLAALLHRAHVAIIRPGYNVTHEAMASQARIVLVPGTSYMEMQDLYAGYLQDRYGVHVASLDDPNSFFSLTRQLVGVDFCAPEREGVIPCQSKVAQAILKEIDYQESSAIDEICAGARLFLMIGGIDSVYISEFKARLHQQFSQIAVVVHEAELMRENTVPSLDCVIAGKKHHASEMRGFPVVFLQASRPLQLRFETLRAIGTRLVLYTDRTGFGDRAKDWCEHLLASNCGLLGMELYHYNVLRNRRLRLSYRVSKLDFQRNIVALYLDLSLLSEKEDIQLFFEDLERWIKNTRCHLLPLTRVTEALARSKLALGAVGAPY